MSPEPEQRDAVVLTEDGRPVGMLVAGELVGFESDVTVDDAFAMARERAGDLCVLIVSVGDPAHHLTSSAHQPAAVGSCKA